VQVDRPAHAVPSTLYGVFCEDINCGAEGGLYAELIQNRSFEDDPPLYSWQESAGAGARGRLVVASNEIAGIDGAWRRCEAVLEAPESIACARLAVLDAQAHGLVMQ
jgi:hypothetical protein